MPNRGLCWIRRDLRLSDHAPLAAATTACDDVTVVFVFDANILDALEDRDDRRVTFILKSLEEVDINLRKHGSRLVVLHGDPVKEIPKLARELSAGAVYTGRDYEPYAAERDATICKAINLVTVKDHLIFEPGEVLNQSGLPFRVHTPFSKAWRAAFEPAMLEVHRPDLAKLTPASELNDLGIKLAFEAIGFKENDLWLPAGETGAHQRLKHFEKHIGDYGEKRDCFGEDATSGFSVHLRFGTISTREAFRVGYERKAEKWVSELIWREFYQMILGCFPHVVETTFNPAYQELQWPGTREDYDAWERGATGFPVVDAAMRCFNATGWMHNRLRMVVASFLTKDLLCDYRWGEAYFARKLLDFDLGQNNGGWQWAASTGVDAQPYFRIFNPILQSRKFDPSGGFIRQWCPELAGFDDEQIHWPHDTIPMEQMAAGCEMGRDYPAPIVDHARQKDLAVKLLTVSGLK